MQKCLHIYVYICNYTPIARIVGIKGFILYVGWLKHQLEIQAAGLSGHLHLFWADVENSSWFGGNADGGLHERAPYWLNGIVPLAYQLQNESLMEKVSVVCV